VGWSIAFALLVTTLEERSQISKLLIESWVLMPALPLMNPSFMLHIFQLSTKASGQASAAFDLKPRA